MRRFLPGLCLIALLAASCAAPATGAPTPTRTSIPESTPLPEPTMTPAPAPFRIIAYATDAIVESIIPYDQLTHINYAFLTPNPDGTFNPINNAWKLQQIVATAHSKNVKVLISVGGWGWDEQFETMAADSESRRAFVQNLKAFVDQFQLDGADIDWEYPDVGMSQAYFVTLLRQLRIAMPDKLLTAAAVSYGEIAIGFPGEAFGILDFINVMTYDGPDHATMEQFEKGLEYWSGHGLQKDKIVMGVPFYSRVKDSGGEGLSFAKIVAADPAAAQLDEFDYYSVTQVYNGIPTVQAKTRIAMDKASGIMFWALDHDAQGEFSLVNAIYQTVHRP